MKPAHARYAGPRGRSPEAATFGRQRWRDLTRQLRDAAELVVRGEAFDLHVEALLKGALKRTGAAPLPVEGASAGLARVALVAAAEGFVLAAGERRSRFAHLLLAAVDLVDALLDASALEAADRTWKRHFTEG